MAMEEGLDEVALFEVYPIDLIATVEAEVGRACVAENPTAFNDPARRRQAAAFVCYLGNKSATRTLYILIKQ